MFRTLEESLNKYVAMPGKEIKLTDYCSQVLCLMQEIRFSDELE